MCCGALASCVRVVVWVSLYSMETLPDWEQFRRSVLPITSACTVYSVSAGGHFQHVGDSRLQVNTKTATAGV